MNEAEFAYKLAGHLSASSRDVDTRVTECLRAARVRALLVQRQEGMWAMVLPGRGMALRLRSGLGPMLRSASMVAVVLVVFALGQYWSTTSRTSAYEDIDAALLMDDLPIDAYLDRDFKAWVIRELRS